MCINYKVHFVLNEKCVVRKEAVAHFMYFRNFSVYERKSTDRLYILEAHSCSATKEIARTL